MKAYLSKQASGGYMLTATPPVKAKVAGTFSHDLYVPIGDPIGLRNMCAAGVWRIWRVELKPFETVQVTVKGFVDDG